MSKSQIKRLHQQQELEKTNFEEEEVEEKIVERKGPANRFAFFDDEENDNGSENDGENSEEDRKPVQTSNMSKKKAKKNKKKAKEVEETENQMLARLAALNMKKAKEEALDGKDNVPSIEELVKIDIKMFDISAEIKRKLGKAFKDAVTPGSNDEHRWPPGKRAIGRIVKNKPRWFPERDYGLSMVQTKEEDGAVWFTIKHNKSYEEKERMFWLAEAGMDVGLMQEIFSDTPYHLNSLLILAHTNRMNEDFNSAADLIERGIFYVDQYAAPTFEPFNWRHRMDYTDYENRAFFLLLHRHMLNAAHKRCWETAWNTAKLIFKLDPVRDPLAIVSIIDVYALKAKQYKWIIHFFEAAKKFKKLHLLPNWPYSAALARFLLAKEDEEHVLADQELQSAIRHFPSVVVQLMDLLQIHPDADVMNCKMLTSFVADNEKDSLKLLMKIYTKETEELWKVPETLLFLENATRQVAMSTDSKEKEECEEWKNKRNKMYHGRSPNVDRLGQLLDVLPTSSLSDPVPPANGRNAYSKNFSESAQHPLINGTILEGFINSLIPSADGRVRTTEEHINELINMLGDNPLIDRLGLRRQDGNVIRLPEEDVELPEEPEEEQH